MSRLRSRAPGRDEWYCRISSPSIPRRNREGQVAVYKRRRRRVPALEGFYFHDKTESGDDGFEYCSGFSVAGFVRHIRNNLCVRREDIFVKQTRLPIGPQIESESALPQADFRSWKPRLISSPRLAERNRQSQRMHFGSNFLIFGVPMNGAETKEDDIYLIPVLKMTS